MPSLPTLPIVNLEHPLVLWLLLLAVPLVVLVPRRQVSRWFPWIGRRARRRLAS